MKPLIPPFLMKQRMKSMTLTNNLSVTPGISTAACNKNLQHGGINLKFSDKLTADSKPKVVTPLFSKKSGESVS